MNLTTNKTISWPASVRADGSAHIGPVVYEFFVSDDDGSSVVTFTTNNNETSITFNPIVKGYSAGTYRFQYRSIEDVDGDLLKGPLSDPLVVTFEKAAVPAKPPLLVIAEA